MDEKLLHEIQLIQNSYRQMKLENNPRGMLEKMWELGDLLHRSGVKSPHSFGWEVQAQDAYVKRPIIFRSFVIRRVWNSKEKMLNEVSGLKSINSLIEFLPILDQNKKWKVPSNSITELKKSLNQKSAKEFNHELLEVKAKFIGVKNNRNKHLDELINIEESFSKITNILKIKLDKMDDALSFGRTLKTVEIEKSRNLINAIIFEKKFNENISLGDASVNNFINDLNKIHQNKIIENRFLRLVSKNMLIELNDKLFALCNTENYVDYVARNKSNKLTHD